VKSARKKAAKKKSAAPGPVSIQSAWPFPLGNR
jgi:hypothetical protein